MGQVESDDDLFALVRRELFVAVVGDVMDAMGLLHQFLPPEIVALHDAMVVLGRALPVLGPTSARMRTVAAIPTD